MTTPSGAAPLQLGRYVLYDEIAAGGMARVHLGRLVGAVGFSRTVAVKRLHAQYARDPEFVAMFLDEARLAARIRHPNVVTTLDVVATSGEVFLVMEYIDGDSLSELIKAASRAKTLVPPAIAAHVVAGALRGLHAAHEARDEKGDLLGLVHRDVSPQNILVGTDGVARVLDFGVAKAAGRLQTTEEGHIKGKMAYMAPEQLNSKGVTRRTDLFAAGVVLWETLACRRLFQGADPGEIVGKVLHGEIVAPSTLVPGIAPELDAVVLKALARDPADRFDSAQEMATALEQAAGLVSPREVGEWVQSGAGVRVAERASRIAEIERSSSKMDVPEEARRAVLAASAEAAEVFRSDSSADATANIGSGRSQIGSVVDPRNSIPPKRMRWLPYAAGAGVTLAIIAGFAFVSQKRNGPATAASPPSLESSTSNLPAAVPRSTEAVAPVATSGASAPSALAPPASSAEPPPAASASAVSKTAPKPVPKATPRATQGPKKPASRAGLYTRD